MSSRLALLLTASVVFTWDDRILASILGRLVVKLTVAHLFELMGVTTYACARIEAMGHKYK